MKQRNKDDIKVIAKASGLGALTIAAVGMEFVGWNRTTEKLLKKKLTKGNAILVIGEMLGVMTLMVGTYTKVGTIALKELTNLSFESKTE